MRTVTLIGLTDNPVDLSIVIQFNCWLLSGSRCDYGGPESVHHGLCTLKSCPTGWSAVS